MIALLRLENIANIPAREIPLDPKGATHIRQPSTWGKSTITHALLVLLCGDAVNRTLGCKAPAVVTGTTGKGATLSVSTGAGTATLFSRDGGQLAGKSAYLTSLGKWGGETARYIVAPMAWRDLATGTAQPLRDLLSRILPAGDVPGRVRELLGDDWRESDPADVKGAQALQTEANAAKERAAGRLDGARDALTRARSALSQGPVVSAAELAAADQITAAGKLWQDYDARNTAWQEFDHAIGLWRTRAPGDESAYSAEEHRIARELIARLEAEARAAETASAVERATKDAEAKAAALAVAEAAKLASREAAFKAEVKAVADKARPLVKLVSPTPATPAPTIATYSDDYRSGFGDARDAAAAIVQWCRENGETDHRSMLYPIRGLTPENQHRNEDES